ncbi:MAG: hypothetical protein ILA30_01510 [Selenomonas sp.]|nr:hypothetical protein [Selenomonas sp.]
MATEKKVYVFFNCDEEKTQKSMNIFYNNTVYNTTKKGRKELLTKVEEEIKAGRVNVLDGKMDAVSKEITDGEPTKASQYLQYASIESLNII